MFGKNKKKIRVTLNGKKKTLKETNKGVSVGDGFCKFPFIFKGESYNECKKGKDGNDDWCATEVDSKGKLKKYAFCDYSRNDIDENKKIVRIETKVISNIEKKDNFNDDGLYNKIDIKNTFDLVIGNVQSGKTAVIIRHVFKAINRYRLKCIIFTRDSKEDLLQLSSRLGGAPEKYNFRIGKIHDISKKREDEPDLNNNNITLALGNFSQIKKCINYIENRPDDMFCICIDEVDLLAGDYTKAETHINELFSLKNVYNILGVTATPMATIAGIKTNKININRIFKLDPPKNYVGIGSDRLKFREVSAIDKSKKDDIDKELVIIDDILKDCKMSNSKKFCITLILSAIKNDDQSELLDKIINRNPSWTGIVFNQDSVKIVRMMITKKQLNYEFIRSNKKEECKLPRRIKDGESANTLSTISCALKILKKKGISKIVIVSGKKANRGISFVDDVYDYHLTDLYIRSKDVYNNVNIVCDSLIQKLRVLGVYKDNMNINLWTTLNLNDYLKKCKKQIDLYTNALTKITEEGKELLKFDDWQKSLSSITQKKTNAPNRMTKKRIEKNIEYKKIDGVDYDKTTDGYCLSGGRDKFHPSYNTFDNPNNPLVIMDRDKIISILKKNDKDFNISSNRIHQLNLYSPDILTDVDRNMIDIDTTTREFKYFKKESLKEVSKRRIEVIIKSLPTRIKFNKLNNILKKQSEYGIIFRSKDFFTDKNYFVKNIDTQLKSHLKEHVKRIVEDDIEHVYYEKLSHDKYQSPLKIGYGVNDSHKILKCPMQIPINFPIDYCISDKGMNKQKIKTNIKEGDIIWWQNLYGKVFVNIKLSDKKIDQTHIEYCMKLKNSPTIECIKTPRKPRIRKPRTIIVKKIKHKGYISANPEIKDLFNKEIIPKIINILLTNNNNIVNFIFCDNNLNTYLTIKDNLELQLFDRVKFIVVEYDSREFKIQKNMIDANKYINLSIVKDDIFKFCKDSKLENKFIYADTCGSLINSLEHYNLIKNNSSDQIITGTFPCKEGDAISHLGRHVDKRVTAVYEYGKATILKTYISVHNSLFNNWIESYIKSSNKIHITKIHREDIIEKYIPEYKKIEEYNNRIKKTKKIKKLKN